MANPFAIGGMVLREVSADPSAGAGISAPVASIGLRDNSNAGEFWLKTGAADTSWTNLTPEGETNTCSNVGDGEDIFKQKAGVDFEFHGIKAGSAKLTATTASDNIELDLGSVALTDLSALTAGENLNMATYNITGTRTYYLDLSGDGHERILSSAENLVDIYAGNNLALQLTNDGTKTTLATTAGDYFRIGDANVTSHSLNSEDDLVVTGKFEVNNRFYADNIAYFNSTTYFYGHNIVMDDLLWQLGTSSDSAISWDTSQTNDGFLLFLGASNYALICERADREFDFEVGNKTDPTLVITSANQATDEWISVSHNQTDGVIAVGTGGLSLNGLTISNDGTKHTILGTAGDYVRLGDAGVTSHALASEDDWLITGKLEVDGIIYADNTCYYYGVVYYIQNQVVYTGYLQMFGSTSGYRTHMGLVTQQTPDSMMITCASQSNAIIFCETADYTYDFAHAQQTNPTLWIQSANQSATEWLSIAHNQTDGVIDCGTGTLNLGGTANVNFAGASYTAGVQTDTGYVVMEVAGVEYRFLVLAN